MPNSHQRGFTLLELIVVSAIIGALAAIAIPQYNSFRAKAERASIISDCRTIYRGFIFHYLEKNSYPLTLAETADPVEWPGFNLSSFEPLTIPRFVGGEQLDPIAKNLLAKLDGNKAEIYDSPDPDDQTFYLILPWGKDPSIRFIIAQSDNVTYGDGTTVVDGGNWMDGVFVADKDGKIIQ